jgi:hypothetical protein
MGRWLRRGSGSSGGNGNRNEDGGGSDGNGNGYGESAVVPFRDANREIGEIPLADIDNFHIPGRDEKGASQPIAFHVPPILARCIDIMVHSKRFPYVNREDFCRHAVVRHLGWLNGIRTTIQPTMMPQLEIVLEVLRDAEFRLRMEKAFKELDRLVEVYMRRGEQVEAVRVISLIVTRMREVESSANQREFIASALRKYEAVMAGERNWNEGFTFGGTEAMA